jgi:type IV pilus assembly protein PilB
MTIFEKKVAGALLAAGAISPEQAKSLDSTPQNPQESFEVLLTRAFKVDSQKLLAAKSAASEVPAQSIGNAIVPPEVLREIPSEAALQYQMVPLAKQGASLMVGMVDPTNVKAQEALRFIFLRSETAPTVVVITEEDFKKIFALYQELKSEVKSALADLESTIAEEGRQVRREDKAEEEGATLKEAPITKVVAVILKHAIEGGASDIHIEGGREQTRVRFRQDGTLHTSLVLPSTIHNSIVARIKILASLRLDESRVPQDGRFSTQMKGKSIDFRVSTFPTSEGEKVVMRVLDAGSSLLDLKQLGLAPYHMELFQRAISAPYGMVLVSGPTGSGKTTTLYAAMNIINKEGVNMVSLEDPVEYYMPGVNQSQIRPEIEYTFATGLRHILRQDPDVIMVGEIRDSETASLAVQASLTGHLVFSTIHTNDAIGVIPRLIDMGVEAFLLPSSLSLIVAQRLVGRLCQYCKQEQQPHPRILSH